MNCAPARSRHHGFTLVELIMVIVIMGAIGGMVSVFMKSPIDAYLDSARRAALTDVADTVVRRMARDIQKSLPNSIRPLNSSQCIEFIPTRSGGRYRAADADALNFGSAGSTSFNVFGDFTAASTTVPADQQIKPLDVIVLYNLGIPGLDAYSGTNIATVTAVAATPTGTPPETALTVTVPGTVNTTFPFLNTTNRFQIVPKEENVVAYVCANLGSSGEGSCKNNLCLYRQILPLTTADPAVSGCPTPSLVAPNKASILASKLGSCNFNYSPDQQHNALVAMTLQLTDDSGESVNLYHEVHVSNTP